MVKCVTQYRETSTANELLGRMVGCIMHYCDEHDGGTITIRVPGKPVLVGKLQKEAAAESDRRIRGARDKGRKVPRRGSTIDIGVWPPAEEASNGAGCLSTIHVMPVHLVLGPCRSAHRYHHGPVDDIYNAGLT